METIIEFGEEFEILEGCEGGGGGGVFGGERTPLSLPNFFKLNF